MTASRPEPVPDESDLRSPRGMALVLTILGLYGRRLGGWISTAHLVALAEIGGVPDALARTALTRLKKRGLLVSERNDGAAGYRLTPAATALLDRGDQRIFAVRRMHPDDAWCVLSFSVPESLRAVRAQVRRRVAGIGLGAIAPGLWIGPGWIHDEVAEILDELDVRRYGVLLRTEAPDVSGGLGDAVARWWDLPRIATLHQEFQHTVRPWAAAAPVDDREMFRRYVLLVDAWRAIPYLDPGLPDDLLPPDWPGADGVALYEELSGRLAEPAWRHVQRTVGQAASTVG